MAHPVPVATHLRVDERLGIKLALHLALPLVVPTHLRGTHIPRPNLPARPQPLLAKHVVHDAARRIGKHLVRALDVLEAGGGRAAARLVRLLVRVELGREGAVTRLDLGVGRVARHVEDRVQPVLGGVVQKVALGLRAVQERRGGSGRVHGVQGAVGAAGEAAVEGR